MDKLVILAQAPADTALARTWNGEWSRRASSLGVELSCVFPSTEGDWVDAMQGAMGRAQGVVICPPAALSGSIALRDAISAVKLPVIEVYPETEQREGSVLSAVCRGCVCGFGSLGPSLALEALSWQE